VLGYYVKGPLGTRDVTIGASADKKQRVDSSLGTREALPAPGATAEHGVKRTLAPKSATKRVRSASDALRQLNRADELREEAPR